ncbi:MAG: histidine kinase [Cyclobacteriaceae bacterium]|nr:histidine kinase [Cyclobacteriaceae bacterium]
MNKFPSTLITRLPLIGAVLLWSGFHAWFLNYYFGCTWQIAGWDSFIYNLVIVSGAALLILLLTYLPRTGIFQISIGLALLMASVCQWIFLKTISVLITEVGYLQFLDRSTPIRWVISVVMLEAVAVSAIFYSRWKESVEQQTRESDLATMAKDAELQKLQLQLQPHFLFNSLNSINALILVNPDEARKMIQELSDFLRLTIKRADEPWISLSQELEYLKTYLAIEKVRFGHRLDVNLAVEEQSYNWSIPTLVLQPLVENAIKFGLYGTVGKISIELKANVSNGQMYIEITNPFDSDMQPSSGSGFGLSGLQRRLYLIYARNDLVKTHIRENTFTVNLTIPAKP